MTQSNDVKRGHHGAVRCDGRMPFRGEIVWLGPEQGGRRSGPPATPIEHDYAATAFVPPATGQSLASFVLRACDKQAWRSPAEGDGLHRIGVETVVVVTEGPKPVAYFHVHSVESPSTSVTSGAD